MIPQPNAGAEEPPLTRLRAGVIRLRQLMPECSNDTYLVELHGPPGALLAIYKPAEGESPLDDFPDGTLGKREVAAYLVSEALGWRIVPPTVYRRDGPRGAGSLQLFIHADPAQHYFTLMPARADAFRVMAVFDWIVNNADRKSGHCLLDATGHIWGVDNGLTFHPLSKLRTVIWEFGGEPVPERLRGDAARFATRLLTRDRLVDQLRALLVPAELRALAQRAQQVSQHGRYPRPTSQWAYPWPLI